MPIATSEARTVVFRIGPAKISQIAGPVAARGLMAPRVGRNIRLFNVAAQIEDKQRRQGADHEHPSPRLFRREQRKQDRLRQNGETPANGPTRLNRSNGAPTILRTNDFAHQDGARRPFTAEAKAKNGARDQKLAEILRERADDGEEGEPQN